MNCSLLRPIVDFFVRVINIPTYPLFSQLCISSHIIFCCYLLYHLTMQIINFSQLEFISWAIFSADVCWNRCLIPFDTLHLRCLMFDMGNPCEFIAIHKQKKIIIFIYVLRSRKPLLNCDYPVLGKDLLSLSLCVSFTSLFAPLYIFSFN